MNFKYILIVLCCLIITSVTFAVNYTNPRASEITQYSPSHWHDEHGDTQGGAVSHSGGTDAYGCHNASVPYHCHNPKY